MYRHVNRRFWLNRAGLNMVFGGPGDVAKRPIPDIMNQRVMVGFFACFWTVGRAICRYIVPTFHFPATDFAQD